MDRLSKRLATLAVAALISLAAALARARQRGLGHHAVQLDP